MTQNVRSNKSAPALTGASSLFVEVFPIRADTVPPLMAYRLRMSGDELTLQNARRVGGRAAEFLREWLGGAWAWIGGRLITDTPAPSSKLALFVEDARAASPRVFAALEAIEEEGGWEPSALQTADWLVRGPIAALEPTILEALAKTVFTIRNTRVSREYRIRTWAIEDTPALSVSVLSRLLFEPDLQGYAATLKEATAMVGLWVADKFSGSHGEIVKLVGLLGDHRARLLELSSSAPMRELLASAPADHWVVRVASGIRDYDYAVDALDLVIRPDDISQFAINAAQMDKALHLKPAAHAQMVKIVSDVLKDAGLIANAFNSKPTGTPHLFGSVETSALAIRWGDGRGRPLVREKLGADFGAHGAAISPITQAKPLRIAVIDAAAEGAKDFLEALRRAVERLTGVRLEIARVRDMRVISQTNLDSAVRLLAKDNADVLLIALPDESDLSDEDEAVNERYARLQTVGRGQSALIVHESTMQDPDTMPQIVMGLLARAGGAPFLAAEPLGFADRVVGLSLFYQDKRDGEHVTGIARIYQSDGKLLVHAVASAPVGKGQGIPDSLMTILFPAQHLKKQRVVLHIDGKLTRDAAQALGRWEDTLDAQFTPVEIIRAGVPRLYAVTEGRVEPPRRGSVFRVSEYEAFVLSSDSSVQPLHVRAEAPLTIDQAIESILLFASLHYGAVKPSKLPVTLHQMDAVASGIARGIFPAAQRTDTAYWL
ncbi:MAG: hypothetical protein SGJ24_19605 [Chloroflexota bacterium]|nr:hypothetical protein [Chloroflexota bacterium]